METGNFVRSFLLGLNVYYGWFIVAACFLIELVTFGTFYSYTIFFGYILEDFGTSYANTSLIFSIMAFVTWGGAAVLGFAIDRYGCRRLLLLAGVLLVSGMVGASRSGSLIIVILTYSFTAGLGMSILYVIGYTVPPKWFGKRRGLATGIAVSGVGVGILIMPPLADALIQRIGWKNTYVVQAALFVIVIAIALLILADRPQDFGVDASSEFDGSFRKSELTESRSSRDQISEIIGMATTKSFGLFFFVLLLAFVPYFAVVVYLVEFADSVGVARRIGIIAVSIVGGLNIVAKVLAGAVADVIGLEWTLAGCVGLVCTATVAIVALPSTVGILLFAGVFGLGAGGIVVLMSPMLADLFGTNDLGTLFGIASFTFALSGVTAPYLVGLGFDIFGTYDIPFLAAAVVGLVAIPIALTIYNTAPQ